MQEQFTIMEKFEITGRGAVVVIDQITDRIPGKIYKAEVTGTNGQIITVEAVKEWLLRRTLEVIEKEAYRLMGLHKQDIPGDAIISFV